MRAEPIVRMPSMPVEHAYGGLYTVCNHVQQCVLCQLASISDSASTCSVWLAPAEYPVHVSARYPATSQCSSRRRRAGHMRCLDPECMRNQQHPPPTLPHLPSSPGQKPCSRAALSRPTLPEWCLSQGQCSQATKPPPACHR